MRFDIPDDLSESPPFNGTALQALRKAQRVGADALAAKLNVARQTIDAFEAGSIEPTDQQVDKLAKLLGVSRYNFFGAALQDQKDRAIDFRRFDESNRLSTDGAKSIEQLRKQLRYAVKFLSLEQNVPIRQGNPNRDASYIRNEIQLTTKTQLSFKNPTTLFRFIRTQIEERFKIPVFSVSTSAEDFRGFAIQELGAWAVGYNSRDWSSGARSFTLIHELAHVMAGAAGLSDPFNPLDDIERYCNKVATLTLAPANLVIEAFNRFSDRHNQPKPLVKSIANYVSSSQFLVAIRLEELGQRRAGFARKWKASFSQQDFPDYFNPSIPIRTEPNEGKKKLSFFGTLIPRLIKSAVKEGSITRNDSLRLFNLKYQYLDSAATEAEVRVKETRERGTS